MNGKKKWRGTGFIVTDNYSDDGSPTNEGPVKGGGEGHTREWISRMGMEQIMDGDSITAKRATSHKSAADVDITAIFQFSVLPCRRQFNPSGVPKREICCPPIRARVLDCTWGETLAAARWGPGCLNTRSRLAPNACHGVPPTGNWPSTSRVLSSSSSSLL